MCGDQYNMLNEIGNRTTAYRNPSKQEAAITGAWKRKRKQHTPWNKITKNTSCIGPQSQHGAKHSTLGSVQGVPVGGNPVVDRHVYFECGF